MPSVYYTMLMQRLGNGALSALKKTWEKDLNITLDDGEWDMICKNVKTVSRVRLIQFKIIQRFYWTPSRLYRLGLKPNQIVRDVNLRKVI